MHIVTQLLTFRRLKLEKQIMFGSQTQWRENKVDEKITSNRNVHTQIFIMSCRNSVGRNAVDTLTRGTKDEYLGWLGSKLE